MSAVIIRLAPRRCIETRRYLERLIKAADNADDPLVGLAVVEIYRARYFVDAVGRARAAPTLTRGMLLDLLENLGNSRR